MYPVPQKKSLFWYHHAFILSVYKLHINETKCVLYVSDFFCSYYGLWLFNHISASINRSFLLLWRIPLCDHSTIYLFAPQLLAIWVISSLGLLWTVLLRNCCTSLLIFWWMYVLITIGCIPWGQVAGLYSSCTLNFCRYRQRVFQVRRTLACLSAILVPLCPHQHLVFLDFYISAIRMGYIVGHFLNVKWEGFFVFFFSYLSSLLYEMPIHVFWAFTYWAMCLFDS